MVRAVTVPTERCGIASNDSVSATQLHSSNFCYTLTALIFQFQTSQLKRHVCSCFPLQLSLCTLSINMPDCGKLTRLVVNGRKEGEMELFQRLLLREEAGPGLRANDGFKTRTQGLLSRAGDVNN